METLTAQDLAVLQNSAKNDAHTMALVSGLTPEQCKVLAQNSLNRRLSFLFDMLSNEALTAIQRGELDIATACKSRTDA